MAGEFAYVSVHAATQRWVVRDGEQAPNGKPNYSQAGEGYGAARFRRAGKSRGRAAAETQ